MSPSPLRKSLRIGHGYDFHRLAPLGPSGQGKPFVLAGVPIDHDHGPIAHSDGDALFHALTDALLGAIGAPDIGQLFPNTDAAFKDADSAGMLAHAGDRVRHEHYLIVNLDTTIVCERPKFAPYQDAMAARIAEVLGIDASLVNVKSKTHEGCDAIGEGLAIEVHAVVLLEYDPSTK